MNRRVVHHVPSMGHGGAERQLTYVTRGIIQAGWDVHVILSDGGANLQRLEEAGATIHHLRPSFSHDPRALLRTVALLRSLRPSVVHTWLTRSDILGGLAALMGGIPWVLGEGSSAPAYPPTVQVKVRVTLAKRASGVISNSSGGDAYWAGIVGDRIPRFVIPNALPIEELDAAPAMRRPATDLPHVVYAGRMSAEKNVERLVEGLSFAMARRPMQATLYGDGPLRSSVTALARQAGDRFHLPGEVPSVWGAMKSADLFVSVSTFEGSPNTVLEAMGCGCALVLSDIAAHRELAGDSAIYADPQSAESIGDAILSALADPRCEQRRASARAIAEKRHPKLKGAEFARVYERVSRSA